MLQKPAQAITAAVEGPIGVIRANHLFRKALLARGESFLKEILRLSISPRLVRR